MAGEIIIELVCGGWGRLKSGLFLFEGLQKFPGGSWNLVFSTF
jgi:hypothetical protein